MSILESGMAATQVAEAVALTHLLALGPHRIKDTYISASMFRPQTLLRKIVNRPHLTRQLSLVLQ